MKANKKSTKIGTTRSGKLVVITHTGDYWEIKDILNILNTEECIDVFCMTEHLIEFFANNNVNDSLSKTLLDLAWMFDVFIGGDEFREILGKKGLNDSAARRAVGKLLVDVEFRE